MFLFLPIFLLYILLPLIGFVKYHRERYSSTIMHSVQLNKKMILHADASQPNLQLIKWGLVAALIALVGIVPLLGLPGAILVSAFEFLGLVSSEKLHGDKMWPIAIFLTIYIPLGWPLALAFQNTLSKYTTLKIPKLLWLILLFWFILALLVLKSLL